MRLIDADALVSKCGDYYVEEGPEYGFIGTLKCLVDMQPTIGGWISVKDGLPKENGKYFVFSESPICKRMLFAKFAKDLQKIDRNAFSGKTRPGWYDYDCDWGYCEFDYVTHWMPLPEMPKEEKHEI